MKYTVLDLVQAVLSSTDSLEVNSIGDTAESLQVATIVRTAYFDLIARGAFPENYSNFNLTGSGDATKPVLMYLPNDVADLKVLQYNKRTADDDTDKFSEVFATPIEDFLKRMHMLDTTEDNVASFVHTANDYQITIAYNTDLAPRYFTSLDDRTILFDSYNSEVDTTLQGSKTICYGKRVIDWTASDTFIPALDDEQFALLLNESKALAWAELKQTQHPKAEQNAKRGWTHAQKTKSAIKLQSDFNQLPFFGRKR